MKKSKFLSLILIAALVLTLCPALGCLPQDGQATLTFDSNGGSEVAPITVATGTTLNSLPVPTKPGFDFAGWYQGNTPWTAPVQVLSSATLVAAWVESAPQNPDFLMQLVDGTYTIIGYTGNTSTVNIPSTHEGVAVTAVSEGALSTAMDAAELIIPASITSVGEDFLQFTSVVKLGLPVHLFGKVGINKNTLEEVVITGGTEIPTGAFIGCSSLDKITLPVGLQKIGDSAFSGCYNLLSIYIPATVTEIGHFAFSDCMKLVEVKNDSAFEIAPLTAGVGQLGSSALNVYSSNQGTSRMFVVEDYVFISDDDGETFLVSYIGHDQVLTLPQIGMDYKINYRAFFNTGSFTSVSIPEGVTEIGYEAFYGCGHIKTFYFPHSLQYIAYSAIFNCAYIEQAHYNGTVAQWTAIDKHSGWNLHAYQFPIYCTNGTAYCR